MNGVCIDTNAKVRAIFRTIPSALSKHEKKFHLSSIDTNARMRRYENAFLWLADAMVANIAYNATSPEVGLDMNLENSSFKCYSLDTGCEDGDIIYLPIYMVSLL